MNKDQATAIASKLHHCRSGERPTGATKRWVEFADDPNTASPVRDLLCWVVEFTGDRGPTFDVFVLDADGTLLKKEGFA